MAIRYTASPPLNDGPARASVRIYARVARPLNFGYEWRAPLPTHSKSMEYQAIHKWVNRNKVKTGICSRPGCNTGYLGSPFHTEWANVSGEYRRDLNDYIELCKKCHWHFDNPDRNVWEKAHPWFFQGKRKD